MINKALRTCRKCGKKAYTKEDLEDFMLNWAGMYKRNNMCKICWNKYQVEMKRKDKFEQL